MVMLGQFLHIPWNFDHWNWKIDSQDDSPFSKHIMENFKAGKRPLWNGHKPVFTVATMGSGDYTNLL